MDWDYCFEILLRYESQFGHTQVPRIYRWGSLRLGAWVARQRKKYKDGLLTPDKIKKLEERKAWCWDILEERWQKKFTRLKEIYEKDNRKG